MHRNIVVIIGRINLPTKKDGTKVSWKEFFRGWKKGMKEITPLQQSYSTLFGQVVSLFGLLWGIFFSLKIGYLWMMTILIGGVVVLAVQMLGNWQKLVILKQMDDMMKQAEPSVGAEAIVNKIFDEAQGGKYV